MPTNTIGEGGLSRRTGLLVFREDAYGILKRDKAGVYIDAGSEKHHPVQNGNVLSFPTEIGRSYRVEFSESFLRNPLIYSETIK